MTDPLEENVDIANTIILWRIYDVLMGLYSNINPDEAKKLVKLHEEGTFVTPPPAYRVEGD